MIDQVWMNIRCVPNVTFVFCYVPPSDSPYFTPQSFVNIHEKMVDCTYNTSFCVISDLNARFGTSVRNIPLRSKVPAINNCTYPRIPDDISSPNDNAYVLSTLCLDNDLVVLNNIKTPSSHFPSLKTYRKNNQWVSELDTACISFYMLNNICSFNVHQSDRLSSDHAPISVELKLSEVNLDCLISRAQNLGGHGSLVGQTAYDRLVNRPIGFNQIDPDRFHNNILNVPIPIAYESDVNILSNDISQLLYDTVNSSRTEPVASQFHNQAVNTSTDVAGVQGHLGRWDQLLNDPDESHLWTAIDSKV